MSDSLAAPNPVAIIDSPIPCSHCGQSLQGVPLDGLCPHCQAPVAATLAPAFIDLQTGTVNADVPCTRCKYNLRSLHVGNVCPECGTPVADDLRSDRLELADPAWRRRILSGVNRLLVAGIAMPSVALITAIGKSAIFGTMGDPHSATAIIIEIILAFFLTHGIFVVTTAEQQRIWRNERTWPRRLARVFAILALVTWASTLTGTVLNTLSGENTFGWQDNVFATALLVAAALASVGALALAMCLLRIARRAAHGPLIKGVETWQQLAGLTVAVGTLVLIPMDLFSSIFPPMSGICAIIFACTCIIGAVLWIMALPGLFLLRKALLRIQT